MATEVQMASEKADSLDLRTVIDLTPGLIHTGQPDGYLDFFNQTWLKYLGKPLEHVLGWKWTAVIHPHDVEGIVEKWRASLASGEPFLHEARVLRADGEYRWMLHHKVALRNQQGEIVKWYGSSIDIEDRKRAEQELRDVIDTIPAIVWSTRPDGSNTYVNKRFVEYSGSSAEQMAGSGWQSLIHPDDLERHAAKWMEAVATGKPLENEVRSRRSDGQYRWQLDRGVPLRDEDGNIVRWYGVTTDIEDRKRAEEALQRSEFYLAEGQRLGHTGSWAFGPAGFDYWSAELFRMYGLAPASKAPTFPEYLDLIHPQDREFMASLIQRMLANASGCDVTKRILRPNGELRYIRCVGIPVLENGTLQRIVGTAMDVTDHELLTQELRRREAYLAEAQRLSHTGSFGWKPESGEIVWSDETYRIFEYDRAEKPTLDMVFQRIHPHDRALAQQVTDRVSKSTDFEHEYRLVMPSGAIKHIHVRAHAHSDSSGTIEVVGAVTDITDRKTSEEKFRRLVDANILGIFISDFDGAITEANDAFLRMLQYDREDLVSGRLRWTDLTPPEWSERDQHAVAEAKANGTIQPYKKEHFRKDGSRVPVLIGGALFESGNEGVAFVLDLSEQKRAEEALRSSEAYLAEAQRLTQTGSWAWNAATGEPRYWSEECYRVLGFDPAEQPPPLETIFQRIQPDDHRAAAREQFDRAIRDKADLELDLRFVHPITGIRTIHSVSHAVLDRCGDLREIVGTVIDITERKAAEEKIREQEMELRQILDFAPQNIAVFGPGGERLYANRNALDHIGLSLEEWRQTPGGPFRPGWFIHPDDRERAARSFSDGTRSGGSAYELELRVQGADGSYRWFLLRWNPLRDDKGQVKRWYVASTDIDERKRAEEKLQEENVALREEIDKASMFEEIVGASVPLQAVLSRIAKVSPTDSTVLITGETGTGKELVARAIHRRSHRSSGVFVSVNCAAIPRDLIASELFGHEKGAFTGATQRRLGRFELAAGGTIFLDEVGELPAETQIALLRVLQEHEFERVGGGRPIPSDVRVIAATNRDLEAAIAAGTFRSDLFYRLNVFPIEIPPLRERKNDIPLLVEYFVDRYARQIGKKIRQINKKTLALLQSYPWPGNIRELQNVIERSVILSEAETFSIDESWLSRQPAPSHSKSGLDLADKLAVQEKEMIEAALKESGGRVYGPSGAAAKLGMPRSTLESKIRSLKINKHRFNS